jgi:uncharacterized protein
MTSLDPKLESFIQDCKYHLVFVTVSGAHLYGFPSADSDYDLRGVHVLPPDEILGLQTGPEILEMDRKYQGLEGDIVFHDAKKFFSLLLKRNGYVLEQLTSPLKLVTSPEHEELLALVPSLLTRHHSHHYLGFAKTQWNLFSKEKGKRLKPLLYAFRVLLTGIHLMRTGRIEANLLNLNAEFKLAYLDELVAAKTAGGEKELLPSGATKFYEQEYNRLTVELEGAAEKTFLPDGATCRPVLHDLLLRLRHKAAF